jgi:hypothetical protein
MILFLVRLRNARIRAEILRNRHKGVNRMEDRCIMCGASVPEGRHVCKSCEEINSGASRLDQVLHDGWKKQFETAKYDAGKPTLSLVPKEIIYEIEKVRSFGVKKYKDPDNWKKVEVERYHQALLRHTLAVWNDIKARDKESGLLHLSHIATNIAFILELIKEE